jgi:hypothetical protein
MPAFMPVRYDVVPDEFARSVLHTRSSPYQRCVHA